MVDLTPYAPSDYSWWPDYAERYGEKWLRDYCDRLFVRLLRMERRSCLKVIDMVRPENYDVFVKCLYRTYRELIFCNSEENGYAYNYTIENDWTEIWRW
ncbi:MAG: hypothetical protein LBN29_11480 [Mediterranea sp.]|jgi:hypothetical protein|nr:hypothetical protein [Mediterranea sp.]